MTTLRDILTRSARLLKLRALGDVPDADETSVLLSACQAMFSNLKDAGIGGPLTDVVISADYTANENERITDTGSHTVTKPTTFTQDDGTLRPPVNGAIVQIVGGATYIYVRSRGSWVRIDTLALDDEQPLGAEHDEAVAAMVAVRAASELQANVSDLLLAMADNGRRGISAKFQPAISGAIDPGLLRRRYFNITNGGIV